MTDDPHAQPRTGKEFSIRPLVTSIPPAPGLDKKVEELMSTLRAAVTQLKAIELEIEKHYLPRVRTGATSPSENAVLVELSWSETLREQITKFLDRNSELSTP